ncbi:unnamed protein product [Hymenolepis diminuta]|uniref:Uncharacterized protein n=1 Tax=Hymenolepis diminuta TaxID=6216 RepID=A0A564YT02_HYMDI|nr:unnamed protein product [Hymenolepis diminuta]
MLVCGHMGRKNNSNQLPIDHFRRAIGMSIYSLYFFVLQARIFCLRLIINTDIDEFVIISANAKRIKSPD